jgi:uncharacterized protein YdaU (DUF1376 family)
MGFSFMPMYVGDILRKTLNLSAENFGAYHYLIYHYWEHGTLPQNDGELAQIAHLTPYRWKARKATLQAFFSETWTHNRLDAERAKAAELIEKRRNAANCRWNAHADASASSTSNPNAYPNGHPDGMESTFTEVRVSNAGPQRPSVRDNHVNNLGISTTPATRPKRQRKAKPADPLPRVEAHADRPPLPTYVPDDDLPESANPETVRAEWKTRRRIPMPGDPT